MEVTLPYKFWPRDYQKPLWLHLEHATQRAAAADYEGVQGARAACVWHRRAGKDLNMIHWAARESVGRVGIYWHVLPTLRQGRRIVWEGVTRDGTPFLDAFPESLVERKRDDEMKFFLRNGSQYQVMGADNPDSLVGANPVGVILSEWSLMDPIAWELLRPILSENGGWCIFIFTPRGRNHGFSLLKRARVDLDWFTEVLTVNETKAVSEEQIDRDRKSGMPEEMIQQEYFCSFDAPLAGSYYGELITQAEKGGRIKHVPYDSNGVVNTCWDLGVSDATSIWFYQEFHGELRFINYHYATGKGIDYYADLLRKLGVDLGYKYGRHWVPHDAKARSIQTGKTLVATAKKLGLRLTVVERESLQNGIQAVRAMLPICYFDEDECETGLQGLREYTKEMLEGELDPEGNQMYADTPKHNWASHPADAIRTGALARGKKDMKPPPRRAPRLAIA
jgi:hypothetical protein